MKHFATLLIVASLVISCAEKPGNATQEKAAAETNTAPVKGSITFDNADFYSEQGEFIEDKAKDAIIALMEYHHYPVYEGVKEKLWVSDYGTGKFTELGLAAHLFMNNEQDRYMLMDMFLLPGQMLPEHWHLDAGELPAKREGWLIRHGKSYVVGIGDDNMDSFPMVVVPSVHMDGLVTTKHIIEADAGMFVPLAAVYSRHWQFGGPEGAIITEVANVHSAAHVRHSDAEINAQFLGG
jgi:D-lyxose ketol-isomerase